MNCSDTRRPTQFADRTPAVVIIVALAVVALIGLLAGVFLFGVHVFVKPIPALFDSVASRLKVW